MLNSAIIMGRLTADPELRTTQSGIAVTAFTVAVNRNYKTDGETQTDFINCVAWRKTAEFINNYFLKGSAILVEGRLESRQYETKDGQKRTVLEVVVSQAHFCGEKKKNESDGFSQGEPVYQQNNFAVLDDDATLPF